MYGHDSVKNHGLLDIHIIVCAWSHLVKHLTRGGGLHMCKTSITNVEGPFDPGGFQQQCCICNDPPEEELSMDQPVAKHVPAPKRKA